MCYLTSRSRTPALVNCNMASRKGPTFFGVTEHVDFPPPWRRLRGAGNSLAVRVTVLIPLVGYLIIFNSYIVKYLELAKEIGGGPPVDNVSVSSRLLLIYFGLCAVALGSVLYARFCPDEVKHFGTSAAYVGGDGRSIGDFALEAIEARLRSSPLAKRYTEIRERFDLIRTDRQGRLSVDYSHDALREDLAALKTEAFNAILHLYFEHLDRSHPLVRALSSLLFTIGFVCLLVPSLQVFWRVLTLLLGQHF
jgi:hypothetical protein